MLPSRGLKPALLARSLKCPSLAIRCNASRKFSSGPCRTALSHSRTHALRPSGWRTGPTNSAVAHPSIMTARNFSWTPWNSSKSTDADFAAAHRATPAESVVTTKTPELAPETLNSPAITETTNTTATAADTAARSGGSSWYNPLSWGSKPAEPTPAVDNAASASIPEPPAPEPVMTATPEEDITAWADPQAPAKTIDDVLDSVIDITKIPDNQIGYLELLGLDFGWGPTAINQWLLEHVHIYTGLGWGLSIIGATLVIRIILLKPMMFTSDNAAKMACIAPVINPLRKKQMELAAAGGGTAATRMVKQQITHTLQLAGVSTWAGLVAPILQGAMGYGTFRLLRDMSSIPVPGLLDGGWAWFANLTVADPYYILPLLIGTSMHLTARFRPENMSGTVMNPFINTVFIYVLPVFLFLVSAWLPAALQISFLVSNVWGLGQQSLLRFDKTRSMLGLTPFPTPESLEFFERVNKGEITLRHALTLLKQAGRSPNPAHTPIPTTATSMKYEAPTVKSSITLPASAPAGKVRLRSGAQLPPHIVAKTQKTVSVPGVDDSPPPEGFKEKLFWFGRNLRWKSLRARLLAWYSTKTGVDTAAKLAEERRKLAKRKADEYEWRRREALKHK